MSLCACTCGHVITPVEPADALRIVVGGEGGDLAPSAVAREANVLDGGSGRLEIRGMQQRGLKACIGIGIGVGIGIGIGMQQ